MARRTAFALAAVLLVGLPGVPFSDSRAEEERGRWAFEPEPDDFRADALLDLRFLNEAGAGETGFVRANDAGDFVKGDGSPIRFWAVNTAVGRERPFVPRPRGRRKAPDLARHARFLAKRGVNMVRCHAHLNPDLKRDPDAAITDVDEAERDWIWRTVAAMKKEGIYTTISPYWPNTMKLSPHWNVPGGAEQPAHGLLFFDETLQKGYRAWWRALLAEPNPYTKIPLAKDPAVALLQLQNEDSLLFWTVNRIQGEQRRRLGKRFGTWLAEKYGSLAKGVARWAGDRLPGDDLASGVVDFHNLWEMTQERAGGRTRRLADQLQFWCATMYAFHRDTETFLRVELGCRQLVNATNWKSGDAVHLGDAERWTYTANDVVAVNRYCTGLHLGEHRGWAIVKGDRYTNRSALLDPRHLPLNLRQVSGFPTIVTESLWVPPNAWAAEGPFLVATYLSVTGIDAFYWFSTADDEWTPPRSANGYLPSQGKWIFATPDVLGTFPAAALVFRRGYVKRAQPALQEQRPLVDLWERRPPILPEDPSYDPNRDSGDGVPATGSGGPVPHERFLVAPVEVTFDGRASATRGVLIPPPLPAEAGRIASANGQVVLGREEGWCTVDAPQAQGVTAFFSKRDAFALTDVDIRSRNEYASVWVVSLDEEPLATSRRVLVQVGTQSRPTAWRERPETIRQKDTAFEGFRVLDHGRAPWQVVRADVTLEIRNARLRRATALDANGNARDRVRVKRTRNRLSFTFPEDALYVVLE